MRGERLFRKRARTENRLKFNPISSTLTTQYRNSLILARGGADLIRRDEIVCKVLAHTESSTHRRYYAWPR